MDHMHRESQGDAQHHGGDGHRSAPGMAAQFLPGKGAEQGEHGAIVAPPSRPVPGGRTGS